MNKPYALLLAAICFVSLPALAQTPAPQDSTKNADVPSQGDATHMDQMQKKDMKKNHSSKMKKSHKNKKSNDQMMNKSDTAPNSDMMKKDDGTSGK